MQTLHNHVQHPETKYLSHLDEDNVVEQFFKLCKARPNDVVAKLKAQRASKRSRKPKSETKRKEHTSKKAKA